MEKNRKEPRPPETSKHLHPSDMALPSYITIRGDSEIGKFLNETFQKSLEDENENTVSSVAHLKISLQTSSNQPLTSSLKTPHSRSCSKINCDVLPKDCEFINHNNNNHEANSGSQSATLPSTASELTFAQNNSQNNALCLWARVSQS
jgi:hypothetical protein